MTAAHVLTNLAAYSAQAACIIALAALVSRTLPIGAAWARYAWWRAVLLTSLALPWLQGREVADATAALIGVATSAPVLVDATMATDPVPAGVPWLAVAAVVLAGGAVLRALWLAVNLGRLARLRGAGRVAPPSPLIEGAERAIGARAEIRYVPALAHPATFGLRRPVVLLPESLPDRPEAIQRAVLCHELLHVRRRDWLWLLAEEGVRTVLWFHPAVWWLISRVQLAREEDVDAQAVRATGTRRAYVEALMAFAGTTAPAPAVSFARRRHLFRRILLISKEEAMSARRIVLSSVAATAVVAVGAWYAMGAFPLAQSGDPGALEAQVNPITPENPIPRRLYAPAPAYPGAAAGSGIGGTVRLTVTLDAFGRVAGLQRQQLRLTNPANLPEVEWLPMLDAFAESAESAVGQWTYDPPAEAPIAFGVIARFDSNGGETTTTQVVENLNEDEISNAILEAQKAGIPPPPPPPPPPPTAEPSNGVLRVGDDLSPPRKITHVDPVYPDAAQDARVGGLVILEIVIDETGHVREARVTRSVPLLDQAALDAVRQWEYEPTLLNGVPVSIMMNVTVNFTLS